MNTNYASVHCSKCFTRIRAGDGVRVSDKARIGGIYVCKKCMPQGDEVENIRDNPKSWVAWKNEAAEQGVHLTALRRGLAVSIFINVILLAVVLFAIGGR